MLIKLLVYVNAYKIITTDFGTRISILKWLQESAINKWCSKSRTNYIDLKKTFFY